MSHAEHSSLSTPMESNEQMLHESRPDSLPFEERMLLLIDTMFKEQMSVIRHSRIPSVKQPIFKYRGNAFQYEFNSDVSNDLQECQVFMSSGSRAQ